MESRINFLVFFSLFAIFAVSDAFDSNWFTKSMDYFTLRNCSSLKQSMIIGDFRECLESPIKRQPRSIFWPWSRKKAEVETESPITTSTDDSSVTSGDTTTNDDISNSTVTSNATSTEWPNSFAWNQWPNSNCDELKNINSCIGKLLEIDCLLENEVEFFNTTKNMFENQEKYVCERAGDIYEEVQNSSCKNKVNMDVNTICYSWNQNKYDWMNWELNFEDGQMCNYLFDLKNCELKSYEKCPQKVYDFVEGYWEAALNATPCSSPPLNALDTKNGGLDVDGWSRKGANSYKKFFDRTKGGSIANYTKTGEKFGEKDTDTPLRASYLRYADNPFLDIEKFLNFLNNRRMSRKVISDDNKDKENEIEYDMNNNETEVDDDDDDDDIMTEYEPKHKADYNDYYFDFEAHFRHKTNEDKRPKECRGYNIRRCLQVLDFSSDICGSTGRFVKCIDSRMDECDRFFYSWELNMYNGMRRTYERIHNEVCSRSVGDTDHCLNLRDFLKCAVKKDENKEIIKEVLMLND